MINAKPEKELDDIVAAVHEVMVETMKGGF